MLIHHAPVLGLRVLPQVENLTRKPAVGRVAEAQLRLRSDALPASALCGQVIADLPRSQDPAVNGPPTLATRLGLETDYQHPVLWIA
jgi:hypothetical protein